jgi:hypothetical protein
MSISSLVTAVTQLAAATHDFDETDLNNESWAWEAYEGNRYALLQTHLELRELAANLAHERAGSERPISAAQRILAQHRAAYRDFQSLFIGLAMLIWIRNPSRTNGPFAPFSFMSIMSSVISWRPS